jgi:hypothetical protein
VEPVARNGIILKVLLIRDIENYVQMHINTMENYKICMRRKLHCCGVEIVAIVGIYKVSARVCFVFEGQLTQPQTI